LRNRNRHTAFERSLPVNDSALFEQLRAGQADAFEAIFRSWYAPLTGVAERMLRDRAAAEEIAQDVMLELWRRRENIVLEVSLRAYLFRATRNRALNYIRHQRVARQAEPYAAGDTVALPAADRQLEEAELDAAVRAAMDTLPERCREVFELSRVHGLKYAEIAQAMDISIKTVEAQMGKAMRMLREKLASWLPEGHGL
jgi:RNA polymerase sigma-70 factor (ECF subfamily)